MRKAPWFEEKDPSGSVSVLRDSVWIAWAQQIPREIKHVEKTLNTKSDRYKRVRKSSPRGHSRSSYLGSLLISFQMSDSLFFKLIPAILGLSFMRVRGHTFANFSHPPLNDPLQMLFWYPQPAPIMPPTFFSLFLFSFLPRCLVIVVLLRILMILGGSQTIVFDIPLEITPCPLAEIKARWKEF